MHFSIFLIYERTFHHTLRSLKEQVFLSFSAHPTMKAEHRSHAAQAICKSFWIVSKSFFSHRFLYVFAKRFAFQKRNIFHIDTKLSMSSRSILSASRSSFSRRSFLSASFSSPAVQFSNKESVHNLDIDMPS